MKSIEGQPAEAYALLHTALVENVQPADLVIGGVAVSEYVMGHAAHRALALDLAPGADVTLERWSTDGGMLVRLAKNRNDEVTLAYDRMLARQVCGADSEILHLFAWRTAKLAGLAASSSLLTVETFDAPDTITDQTFRSLRGQSRERTALFRQGLVINGALPSLPDEEAAGVLQSSTAFLGAVVPIVRDGQQVRPSRPQHKIHLRS